MSSTLSTPLVAILSASAVLFLGTLLVRWLLQKVKDSEAAEQAAARLAKARLDSAAFGRQLDALMKLANYGPLSTEDSARFRELLRQKSVADDIVSQAA